MNLVKRIEELCKLCGVSGFEHNLSIYLENKLKEMICLFHIPYLKVHQSLLLDLGSSRYQKTNLLAFYNRKSR